MISPQQNQIMNKSPIGQNDTEIMPIRNFNGPQDFIFPIDPFQELAESKSVHNKPKNKLYRLLL